VKGSYDRQKTEITKDRTSIVFLFYKVLREVLFLLIIIVTKDVDGGKGNEGTRDFLESSYSVSVAQFLMIR